ncbi:MAG: phage tail tube protein [Planctomycetota bacterium]
MTVGIGLAFGIGEDDTTFGNPGSIVTWVRGKDSSLRVRQEYTKRAELATAGGSPIRSNKFLSSQSVQGTIVFLMSLEGLGLLFKHTLWGTPVTTGTNPYNHRYFAGLEAPALGLTIAVNRGNGSRELFSGLRISRAQFRWQTGSLMEVTLDLIGTTAAARDALGTPSYTANQVVIRPATALTGQLLGLPSSQFQNSTRSLTITVDNKLAPRQRLGSAITKDPGVLTDFVDVMADIEIDHRNDNIYNAYLAGTEDDAVFLFTEGSRSLQFTLHNAYATDHNGAPINGPGEVGEGFQLHGQSGGSNSGFEMLIVNTQDSAIAA